MKEDETQKKCKLILDHNPEWGGDGFYCQHCGVEFVPISSERQRLRDEIEKMKKEENLPPDLAGNIHSLPINRGYNQALSDILKLLE